ncbi:hypothetical protein BLA24_11885 [Streptomyces cinnamoneus]|uniref:Adenylosuccinate lyase C-terminal domain-containing protein n=2 Tax=Streptomyces cinnamoneus TaxID=53446 RepID=A0A2G1XKM9_STRCJ|nr:hypothetical protein BLA24_11885 [Streptomyces cinnamoneus]PPT12023.1 hypothetical protein CYQ11_03125 [Streptomyces cinnamoneus]
MESDALRVCLVGAGPRGLSVLERLCANERKSALHTAVTVHVVDPARPGAGQVWRTGQSRHLLMNTVASQVTVFTDDSVEIEGPVETGPSLYEWAAAVAAAGGPPGPDGDVRPGAIDAELLAETRRLTPDSYPTRALYGRYLEDVFDQVVAQAPPHVSVVVHRRRAVGLEGDGDAQTVLLADGSRLSGLDAVVLAQGHVPELPDARAVHTARQARSRGLLLVPPGNPADADLSAVQPGEPVLLRGLGLNFFDHLALFTLGRGGSFERGAGGRLVYRPSGREPLLYAGSRRGVPYHARGRNEKGAHGRYEPRLLTLAEALRLRGVRGGTGRQRFEADLWPLISREVEAVYYRTLLADRLPDGEAEHFAEQYLGTAGARQREDLLTRYALTGGERWDWDLIERPYGARRFTGRADFRAWLLEHLAADVAHAEAGNVSGPLKAALDVLRDLRNEIRTAVDHGGLEGDSHRDALEKWYTPLNAYLSIGPPASRIEELVAVMDAGLLEMTGPASRMGLAPDGSAFVADSPVVPGEPIRARVLVEARLHQPDLRRTADPLLRGLLEGGSARPYAVAASGGAPYETGGLAVTERPYHVVDARGRPHPRRFAYGVPTEAVHWVTAAGIRPGVNSVTLGDSDAIARAVLDLQPAAPLSRTPKTEETTVDDTTADGPRTNALPHLLDSGLLSPVRAGTPVEAAVSDAAWIQAMLDAEAALARTQARLGTVPASAAAAITAAARADLLDARELALACRETANPVVGLIAAFTDVVAAEDPAAAPYVHRGSTSQDILDTGMMLVAARALRLIRTDLARVTAALARLAAEHRDTPMAGRTLALQAVPITFGLKAAGWLQLVREADERLAALLDTGLPVSLGGAAGTLAGYLEHAAEAHQGPGWDAPAYLARLTATFADETGLARPALPWHVLRTPVATLGAALALTTGALGKMAVDVQTLCRDEIAELAEPAVAGRGASSAMPHKRNPVLATLIRSAALQTPALASVLGASLLSEDERSAGAWHAEWEPLRQCLRLAGGAAHTAAELTEGLQVRADRMRGNLTLTGGRIASERLSAHLTPRLGKSAARRLLDEATARTARTGRPLDSDPELLDLLPPEELRALLDPAAYTGAAGALVDEALAGGGAERVG